MVPFEISPSLRASVVKWSAVLLAMAAAAVAEENRVFDPLTGPKLDPGWVKDLTQKSSGSIETGPEGLSLKAERPLYVLLKRPNEIVGTDHEPLSISVHARTDPGTQDPPGLYLYWDNDNLAILGYNPSNPQYLVLTWYDQGVVQQRTYNYLVSDGKAVGVHLRMVLTSRNIFFFTSQDGSTWRRLGDLGKRLGPAGQAPGRILLGRGSRGDTAQKKFNPDLANNLFADESKKLLTTVFRDFELRAGPEPLPAEIPVLEKRENWTQSLEALEEAGIPRTWLLLGPVPDKEFKLFKSKVGLEPERTDDWKAAPKDDTGRPFRQTSWARPEGDTGSYVDLGEVLDAKSSALAYARAEIEWPVAGNALFSYDGDGLSEVFLNNRKLYTNVAERYERRSIKDRNAFKGTMLRGKNVLKIKSAPQKGEWGFHLRVERNDPGYRIRLLERLLESHPEEAKSWRGAEALLEIARRYEEMKHLPAAVAAFQKVLDAFPGVDEYRTQALHGKLSLLERHRDWSGLLAAGESALAQAQPEGLARRALHACVLAHAHSGKFEAATALVKQWGERHGGDAPRVAWAWRMLAGAARAAGQPERQWEALEGLAGLPGLEPAVRAQAAFEAAFSRLQWEQVRAANSEKPDPVKLSAACMALQKGLALAPGGENRQSRAFAQTAAEDLKAGKHERAAMGYWSAALLALCAARPELAGQLALNKEYALPDLSSDPKTKKERALEEAQKSLGRELAAVVGDVKFAEEWRAIGPFDSAEGLGEHRYSPSPAPRHFECHSVPPENKQ